MQESKVPFQIEFFQNAIEANAYDIAFYLLKVNEEAIFAIKKEMERTPELKVTIPNIVNEKYLDSLDFNN